MSALEMVHVRRMRGEERRTDVCGKEKVHGEKDEGGGREDKCLR